ncbi:MAG: hypothetical protein AAF902_26665 [Chloroflexota bacterium]
MNESNLSKIESTIVNILSRKERAEEEINLYIEKILEDSLTSKEKLLSLLDSIRNSNQMGDEIEDIILDVMDRLTGWCSPSRKL